MKKKAEEDEVDANAWMITFSDLLTLMLTFFVMLLTMSSMETKELNEAFGIFRAGGDSTVKGDQSGAFGMFSAGGTDAISGAQEGLLDLPFKNISVSKMRSDSEELESLLDKLARDAERKITDFSEEEVNEIKKIGVKYLPKGITVYLPNTLFFKPEKADINPHSMKVLELLGNWVQSTPYFVKIEGHTDNSRINTLEFPSNWELSATRANRIMRYFSNNGFIDLQRILAFGYSGFQPLPLNESIKNQRKNSRIEVVFERPN